MESIKTYTRRENAKRAAIAVGVPVDLVQISVHKDGDTVRFGWIVKELPADAMGGYSPEQGVPCTPGTSTTESRPVAPHSAPQREEHHGVRRPAAGGLCAAVWDWLDAHPAATVKEAKAAAPEHGWNANNVSCEFYAWRKWSGLARGVAP